jgi:hypothetical protein
VTFARATFIEHYWSDRWYNVSRFTPRARSKAGTATRGPAIWTVVAPSIWRSTWCGDRRTLVLDEEEFAALDLVEEERAAAQAALGQLLQLAKRSFEF